MTALSPSDGALALARATRDHAVVAVLPADLAPAVLVARGPDAPSFLHSQLTNDVSGLVEGAGNLQARVKRTGHLVALASAHRLPAPRGDTSAPPTLWLLCDPAARDTLQADLDSFLFSDDLTLEPGPQPAWIAVQGPDAPAVCDAVFGPLGFEPWDVLPEAAVRAPRRTRVGIDLPPGTLAFRRSLTGDAGFLVALPEGTDPDPLARALAAAAAEVGGQHAVDIPTLTDAFEVLRIEAGWPRWPADAGDRRRLLPETGLEQRTVSYTKGCYLGQEVIARVRTYGSVPNLLRALRLAHDPGDAAARALIARLPPPGADLLLADGTRAGVWSARTVSPVAGGALALAFLGRAHRTPGATLDLLDAEGVPLRAEVALSPLYAAPDRASRVQQLYDRAIRTFAEGDPARALSLMEEALALDPSYGDAYEAIGVMLGRSGHFHEAIDVFKRLEEVAPDEPMVNTNLSLYYMKIGDTHTAEDEAGKATLKTMARARGKGGEDVAADLAASKRKDAERKAAMFRRVLGLDADDGIALFGLGTALLTLDQPAEAEPILAHALAVDRNNSAVYVAHGRALEALERRDDAVATYKTGIEVASRKGDLMPLKTMEHRLLLLGR